MSVRLPNLAAQRAILKAAAASIGSGAHGVVTTTVDTVGWAGNLYTIRVVLGTGISQPLAATLSVKAITVTLATDGDELPDASANTATLVAAAVDALAGVSAVASGTGATAFTTAIAAVSFTGGHDAMSAHDVAREASLPDGLILALEAPHPSLPTTSGTVNELDALKIANVLNCTLSDLGIQRL